MIDTRDLQRLQRRGETAETDWPEWDQPLAPTWVRLSIASTPVAVPPEPPKEALINRYAQRAMLRALTVQFPEDQSWFAEIRDFPDVWGDGVSEQASLEKLESVLRHWIEWKIEDKDRDIPVIDSINLNVL